MTKTRDGYCTREGLIHSSVVCIDWMEGIRVMCKGEGWIHSSIACVDQMEGIRVMYKGWLQRYT